MTNRELIIKQLTERDDDVLFNFMCPYNPGEESAHCTDPYKPGEPSRCIGCMKEWIDREAE